MADRYDMTRARSRRPRAAIVLTPSGTAVYRNIRRNTWDQPFLILEARDSRTIGFDVRAALEPGDRIEEVSVSSCNCEAQANYDANVALITIWNTRCDGNIHIEVRTKFREAFTQRILTKLPSHLFQDRRIGQHPFTRGTI